MRADSKCRSCKAPVRWVMTTHNHRRAPMDPEPRADGNVWVDRIEGGLPFVNVVLTGSDVPAHVPIRYVLHFTTCPDADTWRRR